MRTESSYLLIIIEIDVIINLLLNIYIFNLYEEVNIKIAFSIFICNDWLSERRLVRSPPDSTLSTRGGYTDSVLTH